MGRRAINDRKELGAQGVQVLQHDSVLDDDVRFMHLVKGIGVVAQCRSGVDSPVDSDPRAEIEKMLSFSNTLQRATTMSGFTFLINASVS